MPIVSTTGNKTLCRAICFFGLLLVLLNSSSIKAQQLPIKTYTTADGLPQNRVKRIVRDSRGFLWFGTADGLSRFDGTSFTNYNEEHGITYPNLNDLIETRKGIYWIATNGGGVYLFNPEAMKDQAPNDPSDANKPRKLFTQYNVGDNQRTNRVNRLFEDRQGTIWAGTDSGLFALTEPSPEQRFQKVEFGIENLTVQVWCFVEDKKGTLWIGTSGGLICRFPNGNFRRYPVLANAPGNVLDLSWDRDGRLWASLSTGLVIIKPDADIESSSASTPWRLLTRSAADIREQRIRLPETPGEAYSYSKADGLAHEIMTGTFQAANGKIWLSSHGGIMVLEQDRFRTYTSAQGLRTHIYTAIAEDLDGNLWFGSMTSGAHRLGLTGLNSYRESDGLYYGQVIKIFEDSQGSLCVLDRGPSLVRCLVDQVFQSLRPNLQAKNERLDDLLQDHLGEWWLATSHGVYRFQKSKISDLTHARSQNFTIADGLGSNAIRKLFEDSRGDIWISTVGNQPITRWERSTRKFYKYGSADGLPPGAIYTFVEDSSGGIWSGFRDSGLVRYANGRFSVFTEADGLPSNQTPTIYIDKRGRLWGSVAAKGLFRIDDPAAGFRTPLRMYTTAEGLSSNLVSTISEDGMGRIYLGTPTSVDRLDPETGQIRQYTRSDGLISNESQSAYRDRSGNLWFGTTDGLSRLVPEVDRPSVSPPVLIGSLSVAGIPQPLSELGQAKVVLPGLDYRQNQVRVDFFSVNFAPGEGLHYEFKLEGADRDWGARTDQRSVNYANLKPGSYRFVVRAVNSDGVVSTEPASVTFTIVPPLWQRWWFVALALLVLAAAVHFIYRYHTQRLLELERVRTRIATDLHDDIGASLSKIAILSEVADQDAGAAESRGEGPLAQIADTSRDMVDAMSDIVWAVNPKRDHLSDLTYRMRRFAEDLLDARDIEFTFRAPPLEKDVRLGADLRREVYLIFKECVNNLVKHSRCTRAELEFHIVGSTLVIKVNDNGIGFPVDSVASDGRNAGLGGHGLYSMKRRASALGGSFVVESEKENGTQVTLKMPLSDGFANRWWKRNYPNGR